MARRYRDIPRNRAEEIQDLAETIANDHFPDSRVEPESIVKTCGITYSFGHYGEAFDGVLECKNGRFHVYCNLDRSGHPNSERTRFTLAHELGHYYIDDHRLALLSGRVPAHPSTCDFQSSLQVEREADLFAACLLMPPRRFQNAVRKVEPGLEGILSLKKQFGTSITSTAIRYVKHDAFPCAVIKWNSDSFGWCWATESFYKMGLARTLEKIENVPPDSATKWAILGLKPTNGKYHQSGSTASFWFPKRKYPDRDPILQEQAVSLGRFGALTLLYPD